MSKEKKETKLSITILQGQQTEFQWTSGLTVLFVLSGQCTVWNGTEQNTLQPCGMQVINPFEVCRLDCSANGKTVSLSLARDYLRLANYDDARHSISCRVADGRHGENNILDQLRAQYAQIFRDFFRDDIRETSRMTRDVLALLETLTAFFGKETTEETLWRQEEAARRLKRILNYLYDHWQEDISLSELAEREHLTPSYLSRFLKKHLNVTFTEMLTEIRLQHAKQRLEQTGDSVTRIGYDVGFRNVHSFIEHFRTHYGITPGEYRKQYGLETGAAIQERAAALEDHSARELNVLLRYTLPEREEPKQEIKKIENRSIRLDVTSQGKVLRHTWKRLINIGYAREGLIGNVQEQLRTAQRVIGFEYVRFHGIFDDDMHVYSESEEGEPKYNFAYVDLVLDFVQSIGLKPYLELSYVPSLLAKRKHAIFNRPSYITVSSDMRKWYELIQHTLRHLIARYGQETVEGWRFTTIGMNCSAFGLATHEELLEQYVVTYRAVKSVDAALSFGGPGGYSSLIVEDTSKTDFLAFAREHYCMPDFFTIKCYPHSYVESDSEFLPFFLSQTQMPAVVSRDIHYTDTILKQIRGMLKHHELANLEIWIEEWNSTIWQRDISGDTCYKAAWLAHNLCRNIDRAESFGYWLLTDFMEEGAVLETSFHGGFGLFTYHGIPKAGWNAMKLFSRLGEFLIASGEDYLVTRSRDGIQILLTNYCHYDNLYRYRYQSLEDPKRAYQVFVRKNAQHFLIELAGVPERDCYLQQYRLGRHAGSTFDEWINMGISNAPYVNELEYLKNMAQPSYRAMTLPKKDNLTIETTIEPHEVQLLQLSFRN